MHHIFQITRKQLVTFKKGEAKFNLMTLYKDIFTKHVVIQK